MGWRKRKYIRAEPVSADVEPELESEAPAEPEVTAHDRTPESVMLEATSMIGPSVRVTGEISGSEDVLIHGTVDGNISLPGNDLTVGPNGRVEAEIQAFSVRVEGEVVGNILAEGRVEVASTGSIVGDIRAGRVVLAEGARFRGRIDMGPDEFASGPSRDEEPASAFVDSTDDALSMFDHADDSTATV